MNEVKVTRQRPAWDWDGDPGVPSDDRAELEALRLQVPRLHDEITTLRSELSEAAEAVDRMRSTLRRFAGAGLMERRRILRSLRRGSA